MATWRREFQTHADAVDRAIEREHQAAIRNGRPWPPSRWWHEPFVGAHVAILEAWLAGELDGDVEELASMALDLLIYGAAWAHGFRLDQLGYSTGSPADARTPSSD